MLNGLRWFPETVSTSGAAIDGIIALTDSLTLAWFSRTMWPSRRSHG